MACHEDIWFIAAFLVFSLLIGVIGFRLFCRCNWYDSICCASMALSNNYNMNRGESGLLFCSIYTLYGSLVFFVIAGLVIGGVYQEIRCCNK